MPNEAQNPMPAKRHVAITSFCCSAIAPALPKGTYFWRLKAPTIGALISYMTAKDGGNAIGMSEHPLPMKRCKSGIHSIHVRYPQNWVNIKVLDFTILASQPFPHVVLFPNPVQRRLWHLMAVVDLYP